jgi:hypothetical protein
MEDPSNAAKNKSTRCNSNKKMRLPNAANEIPSKTPAMLCSPRLKMQQK